MSLVTDLPDDDWELVHLGGYLGPRAPRPDAAAGHGPPVGRRAIAARRRSVHNPFVALRRAATTEDHGEAIGVALVYSGNFLAEVEVEPFGTARLRIGIDPETFSWALAPGAELTLPRRSSSTRPTASAR